MSKIGKKLIQVPSGVEVKISPNSISVKGPKGELKKEIPGFLTLSLMDGQISIRLKDEKMIEEKKIRASWGMMRALVNNILKGVNEGFEKVLEFKGVGYKATVKGSELELGLGFSHPVHIEAPKGIEFKVEKNAIRVLGLDKELVGKVAAEIRSKRKPEPYKGSGIIYQGEVIRRKAGKKAATAG